MLSENKFISVNGDFIFDNGLETTISQTNIHEYQSWANPWLFVKQLIAFSSIKFLILPENIIPVS